MRIRSPRVKKWRVFGAPLREKSIPPRGMLERGGSPLSTGTRSADFYALQCFRGPLQCFRGHLQTFAMLSGPSAMLSPIFQFLRLSSLMRAAQLWCFFELAAVLIALETRLRCPLHLFFRVESDFEVKLRKPLI